MVVEGGDTADKSCASEISTERDIFALPGLVRAFSLLSRSSIVSLVDRDDADCSAGLHLFGAMTVVLFKLLSSGTGGLRCSSTSPCGAARICVALVLSLCVGVARMLFFALNKLSSRASLRALSRTPFPVSIFVFEPDANVSKAGFPPGELVALALPPCTLMPPIRGNLGNLTSLGSTTFDVCFARSFLIPSKAAFSICSSSSTSFWVSCRSF